MDELSRREFRILPWNLIKATLAFFDRVSVVFVNLHINPNTLTCLGFVAGAGVGLAFALEEPVWALAGVLLCGVLDILDGRVAVQSNRRSLFGAILDSSFDRYTEFFMYTGLAYHFRSHWVIWVIFSAFLGSTMVSYTRAKAESLGISCRNVGIMQRAERLVLLFAGTFLGLVFDVFDTAMMAVMIVIAMVSNFTAFQRIAYVRRWEKKRKTEDGNGD